MSLLSVHDRSTLVRLLRVAYPHTTFPGGLYERTADAGRAMSAARGRKK